MTRSVLAIALLATFTLTACGVSSKDKSATAARPATFSDKQLVHSWTKMDWYWQSAAEEKQYNTDQLYRSAALAGVDVDRNGNMYVTTPRWLDKRIPSTLNQVVRINGKSVLVPFPNREQNTIESPDKLRNVLGVEVDSKNRMWLVDMGWVAGEDKAPDGAQKIIVIDLNSGNELKRYAIPDYVANRKSAFLNDLVIDEKEEIAYITDSGNRSGTPTASGIIIYDFKSNSARRVLDNHPSVQDDPARELFVLGERVLPSGRLAVGVNGITLSADGKTLYWNVTTGDGIYSAKTNVLRNPDATEKEINAAVSGPMRIGGGSDGMTIDAKGRIYNTNLTAGKLQYFTSADPALVTIAEGAGFEWPDSLTWDDQGGLYISSNWLNHVFSKSMDFDQAAPNFRIWRIQTDSSKGFSK